MHLVSNSLKHTLCVLPDLLIKAGAKEENIECAAHGASIQLFDGAEKNRVVTIEVK